VKPASRYSLVFVTAPDASTARRLAKLALEARLVACANLIPRIESHYWWQGKIDKSREVLILFKTTRSRLDSLEKLILAHHPYDTAEVIATSLSDGTERYLRWIKTSL
jgi:periplasmic divalent cation tolerance protein